MQTTKPFHRLLLYLGLCGLILSTLIVSLLLPAPAHAERQGFSCTSVTEIPQAECQALVDLYNTTNGPAWFTQTNWLLLNAPCYWYGVSCQNKHIRLFRLEREFDEFVTVW